MTEAARFLGVHHYTLRFLVDSEYVETYLVRGNRPQGHPGRFHYGGGGTAVSGRFRPSPGTGEQTRDARAGPCPPALGSRTTLRSASMRDGTIITLLKCNRSF